MLSNHFILCRPLLLPHTIFPSIRVFSNESVLHIKRPRYWSFSFSISLSNKYAGLIFFRMEWLDLLAVQGTLKSLPQYHSSKATILWRSAFLHGPTLCDPMNYRPSDFPVHHQLLELAQTHVHRISDVVQPSHPLSSPSPPAFNLFQHQGLFQ